MTKDLEETLQELGPGYRAVVDRLVAGDALPAMPQPRRLFAFRPAVLAAASVVAMLGAVAVLTGRHGDSASVAACYTVRATDALNEYRLAEVRGDEAVKEMIRTQNPDGSWKNDFLTRRNADALAARPEAAAQIASKKARRNLRARGLL